MPSVPFTGAGSGTTAVLGTRFVQGLAVTGIAAVKVLWLALAGLLTLIAGAVTLGRGRRLTAGAPLEPAAPQTTA